MQGKAADVSLMLNWEDACSVAKNSLPSLGSSLDRKMGGFRWLFHFTVVFSVLLLRTDGDGGQSLIQNQACHPTDLKALLDLSNGLELQGSKAAGAGLVGWGPDDLGRVVGLDLSNRSLHGVISSSSSVASLDRLEALNFSRNSLRGAAPEALSRLPRLRVLDLSANALSGPFFPAGGGYDSGGFPALEQLNISSNGFDGPHPAFPAAASLAVLDISDNGFSGAVNSSALCRLGAPPLQVLRFSRNAFSGEIPGGLSRCTALVELSLDGNRLTGNIPDVFGGMRWLESVNLASNGFDGELPASLSSCRLLRVINLRNNSLSGEIAAISFDLLTKLTAFDCGTNKLSGAIPPGIATCTELRTLNLARNRLVGDIPESFKDLRSLSLLSLTGNGFTNLSSALQVLQHLPNLTSLVLSRNFRGGEAMPVGGIDGFRSMQVLVLANCLLTGVIPPWLQSLQSLIVLDISWNKLNGNIPPWLGKLNNLLYIDLSNNSFTGELPVSLTHIRSLAVSTNDGSSGQSPAAEEPPSFITSFPPSIILSNNLLAGPILSSFGHLVQLHILDLSWNNFSGTIPDELSNMSSLEVLNLAHNNLDGTIPSSLTKLNFLSKFDVSYNNLTGVIPTDGQFSTFSNEDFEGNSELCLLQNAASCSPREASVERMDDDTDTVMLIMHTTAAVGFVLGLTTISTAMLFARAWRAAYFLMVDRFFDALYVFTMVNMNRITRKNGQ
ncbi:hypothetical protein U9M48_011382 [Paspalum notatum var. saurae]|uniref:Leucine-rich repeat-containing N-terminal plant-type domain-containing protein n=1 Tax=Paspalum notatum var. saurae TaxID=547442 RepID=A0AAQ3WH34_PASNO